MKEFTINNYLEDIRKKVPAYDLMLEIIFNSILEKYKSLIGMDSELKV